MNDPSPTVFVVDDDLEVRTGFSRMLSSRGYRVRTFESGERFLEEYDDNVPGCVLLDLSMPGLSGLEVQRSLAVSSRNRAIVFLTAKGDIPSSVRAVKAGAVEFLTKPIDVNQLLAAVDEALRVDAEAHQEWVIRTAIKARLRSLTRRERCVLDNVLRGRLNKQIAFDLGIAEKTVKIHRGHIMSKMKVRSVAELTQLVASAGVATGLSAQVVRDAVQLTSVHPSNIRPPSDPVSM
jgi:FixJ family two-component response regulator